MPSRSTLAALELHVFGVPRAVVHGAPTRLPLKRGVALVAYLAINGGPVPRSHLASMLWPDVDEARARTRLRRLAYALEEALGDKILSSDHDSLAISTHLAVAVDALQFAHFARRVAASTTMDEATVEQARRWIVRARSPLLQGIDFESDAFDDWRKALCIDHEHLLARLLERVVDELGGRGDFGSAMELAEWLLALDFYRESSHVLLMQLHARQGHSAGVEASYTRCADALRAEFGIRPSPQTEDAYTRMTEDLRRLSSNRLERPFVRYAEGGLGAVAYTSLGAGEQALVICPGFVSHIEIALEYQPFRAVVEALAERFQVVLFDRRGVGLSERLGATSTPGGMAADVAAILEHAGITRAWLFGSSEGGLGAMRFALDHPERVHGLCLFGSLARGSAAPDYPWALPDAAYDVCCSAWSRAGAARWASTPFLRAPETIRRCAPGGRAWSDMPRLRVAFGPSWAACATRTCVRNWPVSVFRRW